MNCILHNRLPLGDNRKRERYTPRQTPRWYWAPSGSKSVRMAFHHGLHLPVHQFEIIFVEGVGPGPFRYLPAGHLKVDGRIHRQSGMDIGGDLPALAQIFQKNIARQRKPDHKQFPVGIQIHNKLDHPRQILTRAAIPEPVAQPDSGPLPR